MNMLSADELASLLGQQDVGHEVVSSGGGALSLPPSRPHFRDLPARFSAGVSRMLLQANGS